MGEQSGIVYLDGLFVAESAAALSPNCRGLHYGDGVFETMRSYGGRIFRLESHVSRMIDGLGVLGISMDVSSEKLFSAAHSLLHENRLNDAVVKLIAFRSGWPGALPPADAPARVLMTASAFNKDRKVMFGKGIEACVVSIRRNPTSPLSGIKSLNYLDNILGKMQAHRAGCREAVFLNTAGFLTECATANLFFVKDGSLFTPSAETGILPGITRKVVCEIAYEDGLPLREGAFSLDDLIFADEAFLTNCVLEIFPLLSVDGNRIGGKQPGPVTAGLMKRYAEMVEKETAISES